MFYIVKQDSVHNTEIILDSDTDRLSLEERLPLFRTAYEKSRNESVFVDVVSEEDLAREIVHVSR